LFCAETQRVYAGDLPNMHDAVDVSKHIETMMSYFLNSFEIIKARDLHHIYCKFLQKDLLEILFYKTFMLYHHELMSYPATHGCSKSKKVGMAN